MSRNERQDPVDQAVIQPLRRAASDLDDVRAARLAAGIEAALDADAARPAPKRAGRRGGPGAAAAALAVAAALAAAGLLFGPHPRETAAPAPAPRLEAPAGSQLRTELGSQGRLTLTGPGSITRTTAGGVMELAQQGGLLVVDYHNGDGARLRVRSRGVVVSVVGTLFAVDARGPGARVAVARGVVQVEAAGVVRRISAGWSWHAGEAELSPLPADLARALDESGGQAVAPSAPAESSGASTARVEPRPRRTVAVAAPAVAPAVAAPDIDTVPARAPATDVTPQAPPAAGPPADDIAAAYAAAERMMRAGAVGEARRALADLVARAGSDPRAEPARLDLAGLALRAGHPAEARRVLADLPDPTRDPALNETARHLRCRVEVIDGATADAASCLRAFRRQYPASPHDAEALAQLAALASGCAESLPLLEEYLRRYPTGPFAAQARKGIAACPAP